jgi:cell division protein ZapA
MSSPVKPVNIIILGKEYKVACSPEEQESLLISARKLDKQMREIQDAGKINGGERIAVMVALNIMHELHLLQHKQRAPEMEFAEKLSTLREQIENVLQNP